MVENIRHKSALVRKLDAGELNLVIELLVSNQGFRVLMRFIAVCSLCEMMGKEELKDRCYVFIACLLRGYISNVESENSC